MAGTAPKRGAMLNRIDGSALTQTIGALGRIPDRVAIPLAGHKRRGARAAMLNISRLDPFGIGRQALASPAAVGCCLVEGR